ncbi:hypothetical protein K461DRAFT_216314, partial [Myriangium duriaei CBS 260.36]
MPPRIPLRSRSLRLVSSNSHCPTCQVRLASVVTAQHAGYDASLPIARYPETQPPSHKSPTLRKSQLHRQYQSLLHSNPLILILQHNNLKAAEWAAIHRELNNALEKVDKEAGGVSSIAGGTKISIIHTGVFESALKVVEFWKAPSKSSTTVSKKTKKAAIGATDPAVASPRPVHTVISHGLSEQAWKVSNKIAKKRRHGLEPLLSGPLALVSFPSTSPEHLAAALKILSPSEKFPAPKRKANPEFYSPQVQSGLQKLMLLGARVEGRAMDDETLRWVGGIEGGLSGLRAQLVGMLSSAGVGLASALDGASRSLYLTMESRRMDMEESDKSKTESE